MQTITALTAQKKKPDRVNVYLDGAFAFGLPLATATKLKVGQALSTAEVESLQQENLLDKARQSAARLLSYRPRSEAEVRRHLNRKGFDELLITAVIARLRAVELLDDAAFARYWVEQRETFRPRSRLALRQELHQKGIGRDVIEAAVAELDETAAARRAAEKKARLWADLPAQDFRLKLGRFLQRRGFHYGIIKQITNELWQSIAPDAALDDDAIT